MSLANIIDGKPAPQDPNACPWYKQALSWGKRHVPLLVALLLFGAYLFGPTALQHLALWAHGAPPIVPGGPDLDGAQVLATQQAGGWKQLGTLTSVLAAAAGYFMSGVALVWFALAFVVPVLPAWAKKDYKATFLTLPSQWQFVFYTATWLGLLFFFALCLAAASQSQ